MIVDTVRWHIFFFNDTATTEIYTLSLHDALPIFDRLAQALGGGGTVDARLGGAELEHQPAAARPRARLLERAAQVDRKSTRLNSSHANISYAVFCLKKKNKKHVKVA